MWMMIGMAWWWPIISLSGEKLLPFRHVDNVVAYHPRPFDRRIAAQQGLFTFHPNISVPAAPAAETGGTETQEMVEIPIYSDDKHEFLVGWRKSE
jgi:hypothetical protein